MEGRLVKFSELSEMEVYQQISFTNHVLQKHISKYFAWLMLTKVLIKIGGSSKLTEIIAVYWKPVFWINN